MCGRYAMATPESELVALFDVDEVGSVETQSWNVAPTDRVPIVVEPRSRTDEPPLRRLEPAMWGLVPPWSSDARGAAKAINARSETVATTRMFRAALASRRAIVPATGWYEWRKPDRTPFFVSAESPIAFAGLYEWWRQADGSWLLSTTILTAAAAGPLADLHERMPVVLDSAFWDTWLDPETDGDAGLVDAVVEAAAAGVVDLRMHEVSKAVGNVRNDGPELAAPIG